MGINHNQRCDNCSIPMINKRMNVKYCLPCSKVIKEFNRVMLFLEQDYKRLSKNRKTMIFKKIILMDMKYDFFG